MWTRFVSVSLVLSDQAVPVKNTLSLNLHSLERQLIELQIEHADINALVDIAVQARPVDELMIKRLKKRRLLLRDRIAVLQLSLAPPEPA